MSILLKVEESIKPEKKKGEKIKILGGYSSGVPPLPIPNREVKPAGADGTAKQCGRVGSRPFKHRSG